MNAFPTHHFWLGWTLLHAAVMAGAHWALAASVPSHSFLLTPYPAALALALVQAVALRGPARWVWTWPILAVGAALATFVFNWVIPVGLGFALCLVQWPSLATGEFRRTWLWPLVGGVAWVLGLLTAWLIINPMRSEGIGGVLPPPYPLRDGLALAVHGLLFGAATGYALVLMRPKPAAPAGTLFWDSACPFCIRWVNRLAFVARQGGFALVPLQSEEARRDLGLREGELPAEMKLRLADGRLLGGLDAFIAMAEAAGWLAPLGWFLRVPGVNALAWRGYRWGARNRHCLGGICALPPREGRRV